MKPAEEDALVNMDYEERHSFTYAVRNAIRAAVAAERERCANAVFDLSDGQYADIAAAQEARRMADENAEKYSAATLRHKADAMKAEQRAQAAEERAERAERDAERKDEILRACAYFMASFSEDCCIASSNLRQSCEHESAAIAGEGK